MRTTIYLTHQDWVKELPTDGDHWPTLARCDLCEETATDDFMALKGKARDFFRQVGGEDDGLIVCEHCLDRYLEEPPR